MYFKQLLFAGISFETDIHINVVTLTDSFFVVFYAPDCAAENRAFWYLL